MANLRATFRNTFGKLSPKRDYYYFALKNSYLHLEIGLGFVFSPLIHLFEVTQAQLYCNYVPLVIFFFPSYFSLFTWFRWMPNIQELRGNKKNCWYCCTSSQINWFVPYPTSGVIVFLDIPLFVTLMDAVFDVNAFISLCLTNMVEGIHVTNAATTSCHLWPKVIKQCLLDKYSYHGYPSKKNARARKHLLKFLSLPIFSRNFSPVGRVKIVQPI